MKKKYFLPILLLVGYGISAQVGINTSDPKATLDVQRGTDATKPDGIIPPRVTGDQLRLNTGNYGADQNGAIVYVTAGVTVTTDPKTAGVTNRGLYIYDHLEPNGSGTGLWQLLPEGSATSNGGTGDGAYAAKFTSTFSLVGLSIAGGTVDLNIGGSSGGTTSVQVPSTAMSNGIYTVPSTGLYQITYNYREGSGASVSLLTNSGIRISRTPANLTTATVLDSKGFGGVSVVTLLTVSITQTSISHIYNLTAGDKIQFSVIRQGALNLDLTTAAEADVSIFRIK